MAKYREDLPQLSGDLFLTDGGLETTLIFHKGFDLPHFAAFTVFDEKGGIEALMEYYRSYIEIAVENGTGFILEGPTWRASEEWGRKMGYSNEELAVYNKKAMKLLEDIRKQYQNEKTKMPISCCLGPRGDGYNPNIKMTIEEAERYHSSQINTISKTEADMVSAFTMNYTEEAIGVVRAAQKAKIPVVISFTVETDGKLPSGEKLKDAIERVDRLTNNGPVYYMINCAHPTHFMSMLDEEGDWIRRIRGIRSNASTKSHAELDEAEELDDGDPVDLGNRYIMMKDKLGNLNIFGGCCGTDHRHIQEFCSINEKK